MIHHAWKDHLSAMAIRLSIYHNIQCCDCAGIVAVWVELIRSVNAHKKKSTPDQAKDMVVKDHKNSELSCFSLFETEFLFKQFETLIIRVLCMHIRY